MHKPYFPGEMSRRYQMLPAPQRASINREIDKRFKARTGINRPLNPASSVDREAVNDWLRIRDEVMAERSGSMTLEPLKIVIPGAAEMTSQDRARALVDAFEKRATSPAFTGIKKGDIVAGLRARIGSPGLINQGQANLCPSASIIFSEARVHPVAYTKFVIDLYENGKATLGEFEVTPGSDLKAYTPPAAKIDPVDWVPMASIRDSENWFFDYEEVDKDWHQYLGGWDMWDGGARSGELAKWLGKIGYTKIVRKDAKFITQGKDVLLEASRLRDEDYKIIMLFEAKVLELQGSEITDASRRGMLKQANHFVVLTSPVRIFKVGDKEMVDFTVFTWGAENHSIVPAGAQQLELDVFLRYYYGFIGAKY